MKPSVIKIALLFCVLALIAHTDAKKKKTDSESDSSSGSGSKEFSDPANMMKQMMQDPFFFKKMAKMFFGQKSSSESESDSDETKSREKQKDNGNGGMPASSGAPSQRRKREVDASRAQRIIDNLSPDNKKTLKRGERKMPLEAKIFTYYMKNFGCKDKKQYKAFMKRVKPMLKEKEGGSGKVYEKEVMSEVARIGKKLKHQRKH